MFDDLLFCLNATVPIFLLMLLGYFFRATGLFNEQMTKGINRFVFAVGLPVLVYEDLASANVAKIWDTGFVIFCFLVTVLSIIISYVISRVFMKGNNRAEFVQGSFRSSAALLGVGIAINLYGDAGLVPLMIIGAVPLYNVSAVVLLSLAGSENKLDARLLKKTLLGIVTNPIIIGIILGIIRSFIPHEILLPKTVSYISGLATPLGLLALGASFDLKAALKQSVDAVIASFMKLIGFCVIWLPVAIHLGYTNDKLIAVLIMLGSPTTVSCFVMAKNMKKEGTLSASIVMLTTLLSAFTLTIWLYILRSRGLI